MSPLLKLLATLGIQSIRAHKTKSLIVGGLMAMGAFLVVLGGALQGSLEHTMRTSIVDSVTGDIQLYAKDAKDKLAIFGGFGFGSEDLGEIKSFADVQKTLAAVDNVKTVIPMGITNGGFSTPGDLDRGLADLRDAVRSNDAAKRQTYAARIRQIATVMKDQARVTAALSSSGQGSVEAESMLARASDDELWKSFEADPLTVLDELDAKLAPLGDQGGLVYLRMIGTDLPKYGAAFPKFKIIEGSMVPEGKRGLMIGKKGLDSNVKMGIAMTLDKVDGELKKGKTIAGDKLVQELVQRNVRQARRIMYYFTPTDERDVQAALKAAMPDSKAADLPALLQDFMNVNDDNFNARYKMFYDVIGPRVQLYPFKVGDTITLTAFSKSGYLRSVNVKVYGTYAFDGLESSDLAGGLSLVDMLTFRELYGQRTKALDDELKAMRTTVGAASVSREGAEAALFGGDAIEATTVTHTAAAPVPADTDKLSSKQERADRMATDTFTQADVDNGVAISIAVQLKDPSKLSATLAALNTVGEPMGLQAVDWQRAAGFVGQFIWVIRGVLSIAILIIFIVAVVIINNSMVMATLERVAEIGTLRALGAKKSFVTWMILFETGVLGLLAGGVGALAATGVVLWLGQVGIPSNSDVLTFLFAGPRLYPHVTLAQGVFGLLTATVVSVVATLYPARLATKIQPVVAMQGKE